MGGWFRIGNRANEGTAEMTVCLYLPPEVEVAAARSGSCSSGRRSTTTTRSTPAGMKWTMVKPFEELKVDYDGKVVLLDEPEQMADPKAAFTNNPYAEAEVHLTFTGQGRPSMFGGEPDDTARDAGRGVRQGPLRAARRRHRHDPVGDREWDIDGFGLRDHSWGPRYWQAPWYYRWLTANVDDELRVHGEPGGQEGRPGHTRRVRLGGRHAPPTATTCEITTVTRGDESVPRPDRGRPAFDADPTGSGEFSGRC